jgi:dolichol-phosphate mannosyltransferase
MTFLTPPPRPIAVPRIVAIPIAYNEAARIGRVIERLLELRTPAASAQPHAVLPAIDFAVVDDGSTDGTAAIVRARGVTLIDRAVRGGAGAAIRTGYEWARRHGYDIAVILAGNDKDRPSEMHRLFDPIVRGEADLVQGSRYIKGGRHEGTPLYRRLATALLHPWLFSLAAKQRMTDTTNGFRALRLSVLDDPRIDLQRSELDTYQLEPHLLLTVIRLGYVVVEAPVSKIYPADGGPHTKMKPLVDWWRILQPVVRAGLER